MKADGIVVHVPSLVDDVLLVTEPENVDRAVHEIATALEHAGTKLKLEKCAAFVPQYDRDGGSEHPAISSVKQVHGGLPALGAAYSGDYESLLGVFSVAAEHTKERTSRRKDLAEGVCIVH